MRCGWVKKTKRQHSRTKNSYHDREFKGLFAVYGHSSNTLLSSDDRQFR